MQLAIAEHGDDSRDTTAAEEGLKVYAACLGDSQACIFDQYSGAIVTRECRLWDDAMGTIETAGEDAMLPYETTPHGITGGIVRSKSGEPVGMQNDPTGVGFREYELLRRRNRIPSSKDPKCMSNMPGEERWRLLDLEPTRALGHVGRKHVPTHCPEIYEWSIPETQNCMMLMCCDGFFSKSAFTSPEMVTKFLVDPIGFCHRPGDPIASCQITCGGVKGFDCLRRQGDSEFNVCACVCACVRVCVCVSVCVRVFACLH
jgi:hypothetical protein